MNHRQVLEAIERDIIESTDRQRRPFGLQFVHNIAQSMIYFYDRAHITGYNDFEYLRPILENIFTDVNMETWSTPIKYLIEDTNGSIVITVLKWDYNINLGDVSCDKIVKVSYMYPARIKHEFHVRVL